MIEPEQERALLVFIKNPLKGQVKTRLAKTVGDDQALKIYLALLKHTCKVAAAISAQRLLFYSHFIDPKDAWPAFDFEKMVQEGDDLGARMQAGFEHAFRKGAKKAVIIGSDCASLKPEIIEEAFEKLDDFPFVIGPAEDGGYYLLGMKESTPQVFENIVWSTENVLDATLERIKSLGKNCYHLPTLSDIDREEDWEKYGWKI